jgi:transcriptional regulator with XRE-family HTH domain
MDGFGPTLARLRAERGISLRALQARVHYSRSYLSDVEHGKRAATLELATACDAALNAHGVLVREIDGVAPEDAEDYELARRVGASDAGRRTLELITVAVDELATAYPVTAPDELAGRVRRTLRYVGALLERRMTLAEHRELLVVAGWLSLLGATVAIDERRRDVSERRLRLAEGLAADTGHAELAAWCAETRAWDLLTDGEHTAAVELSRHAQDVAPNGSSAQVQATAQEGRAWARLGERDRTWAALDRVHGLAAALPVPATPEHHYRYDPTKLSSYTATTLAWLGDPAAAGHARTVIARLTAEPDPGRWPRRVAAARLDLALALATSGEPEGAMLEACQAFESGRVVRSNRWRAREVIAAVADTGAPVAELREAYRQMPSW